MSTFLTSILIQAGRPLNKGDEFIKALRDCPQLLQLEAYPQYVFFLLSEDNFRRIWNRWLAAYLEEKEYCVSPTCSYVVPVWCTDDAQLIGLDVHLFYGNIKRHVIELGRRRNKQTGVPDIDNMNFKSEHLRQILKRTIIYWDLAKTVQRKGFEHKAHRVCCIVLCLPTSSLIQLLRSRSHLGLRTTRRLSILEASRLANAPGAVLCRQTSSVFRRSLLH